MNSGICECGCGKPTNFRFGKPRRFLMGHRHIGTKHHWKGGRVETANGYIMIHNPRHPRANVKGYVPEQILIIERVLGKILPPKSLGHHFNRNKKDNTNGNLVACEDNVYHMILHSRQKALRECGNPNYFKCGICHKYDSPLNLISNGSGHKHKSCEKQYRHQRYLKERQNA